MRVLCAWFPKLDIELIVRQRPTLAGRPIVLLQGHGDAALVSGVSCEASRLGILTGMSAGQARRRSPGAVFLADNSGACLEEVERVAGILRARVTTRVAVGGRDYVFAAIECDYPDDERAVALRVMGIIRAWAGRTVRGGLAATRTEALEAARASRRGLLIVPEGSDVTGEALPSLRDEAVSARRVTAPLPGLAARAAVGVLAGKLETVLAARTEGFRSVCARITTPEGVMLARGASPQPLYSAAEAMALLAAQLAPEGLDGATAIELTFGRLAPDVRVKPLGAATFERAVLPLAG